MMNNRLNDASIAVRTASAPYQMSGRVVRFTTARSVIAPYRWWVAFLAMLVAPTALAYQVSVGTYVSNAGKTVTVPVALDSAAGLSYAGATLTYDPQVLVVTKAEAGSLKTLLAEDFVATDTNGTLTVAIFGSTDANVAAGSGSIANVTFAARDGTEGLYSDIAVSDVELGEKSGVKDVTAGSPVRTVNGMVRVVASSAAVVRLDSAQTICADTSLGSLALKSGDSIQASDAQTAIVVSGAVTSESAAILVKAPVNGWASGKYALLSTATAGLAFALEGAEGTMSSEVANGITTYYATLQIAGEVPVVCDDETLSPGSMNQIRSNARLLFEGKTDAASLALKAKFEGAKKLEVSGPADSVSLIADMGISPAFGAVDETGTLMLTYTMPKLEITSFDPQTGAVRFKVTPGEGNQIVSEIATGYIHVYGTDNLGEKMKYISKVGFDLTPYLKSATKGEGIINVTLGTHTFLKVKIENMP